ncbi:1-deoxy-D-xylulose-5-phosphate reductoisomerase [Candidatus Pelagibacter sp.]|nr:1-deoxy-D-xylulose-5-phosphate reductoisomerase [Candidatus Pelagibacter sp.]
MIKKIAILGSTGSIGVKTLQIIRTNKKEFNVILLSTNKNLYKIIKQAKEFNVKNIIINNYSTFVRAKNKYKNLNINFYNSFDSLKKILAKNKLYYTMVSVVGLDGLDPTLKIIRYSKNIAIVNKESLICGWNLIKRELKKFKSNFIPIDSEHFSISELLYGSDTNNIEKVFITASGGPFLKHNKSMLSKVTLKDALNHPNWKMGKKISIDSATMMNKVFEVIEAKNIFNINYNKISILVHPKSYVHSMIKFYDGQIKILAHETDMKIPIHKSLYQKEIKKFSSKDLNLDILNDLKFSKIDDRFFPTIKILQSMPVINSLYETVLVTINDYLVSKFLKNKIKFEQLVYLICKYSKLICFTKFKKFSVNNIDNIYKTRDYVSFKLESLSI